MGHLEQYRRIKVFSQFPSRHVRDFKCPDCLLNVFFPKFCMILPNRMNVLKHFHRTNYLRYFVKEVQDYNDGNGLQFMKFDFGTG